MAAKKAEKVKLSKDGNSIDFVQSESLPTSSKNSVKALKSKGFIVSCTKMTSALNLTKFSVASSSAVELSAKSKCEPRELLKNAAAEAR